MKKIIALICAVAGLSVYVPANAGSITTTFGSNNSSAGNMFDVSTFGNALTITGLDVNIGSGSTHISLYTRSGTYNGFQNSAAGWTLQGSILVTSAGTNNPTFVDIADFGLAASSVTGFYVTNSDFISNAIRMSYTNGNNTYSNSDIQLNLGIGKGNPDFTGSTFSPRTWNGTVYYEVSEPVSGCSAGLKDSAYVVFTVTNRAPGATNDGKPVEKSAKSDDCLQGS